MKITDLNELWVGDMLQVISTGIVGKYSSHRGTRVIIDCKGHKITADKSDIRIYKAPKQEVKLTFEDKLPSAEKTQFGTELDLHIEILAPHMQHQPQARLLDFQLEKARQFIETAIDNKRYQILIIHGKGSGILKAMILNMLQDFQKVRYTFDKNDGGATEIWLDI